MRVSLAVVASLCGGAISLVAAQETEQARMQRLKSIAPALLGRAYLVNESTLQLIGMARQGANVHLSGEDSVVVVTSANADSVGAEYERRRATYAAAIRARGFASIAGEYEAALTRCREASLTGPILVAFAQEGFEVSLEGAAAGVVVERTLVMGQGEESDDSYRSGAVGSRIEMHPFAERGCGTTLTRYRRPNVRLEDPASLVGTWEGLWDGQFGVRFTITPSDSGYAVKYEWQEYQGGPYQEESHSFHPTSTRSIRGGPFEITVIAEGEYRARAVGNFAKTRVARLKRTA